MHAKRVSKPSPTQARISSELIAEKTVTHVSVLDEGALAAHAPPWHRLGSPPRAAGVAPRRRCAARRAHDVGGGGGAEDGARRRLLPRRRLPHPQRPQRGRRAEVREQADACAGAARGGRPAAHLRRRRVERGQVEPAQPPAAQEEPRARVVGGGEDAVGRPDARQREGRPRRPARAAVARPPGRGHLGGVVAAARLPVPPRVRVAARDGLRPRRARRAIFAAQFSAQYSSRAIF